jgi:hypothetical protein
LNALRVRRSGRPVAVAPETTELAGEIVSVQVPDTQFSNDGR